MPYDLHVHTYIYIYTVCRVNLLVLETKSPTFSLDSSPSKLAVHMPCGPTDPQCPCKNHVDHGSEALGWPWSLCGDPEECTRAPPGPVVGPLALSLGVQGKERETSGFSRSCWTYTQAHNSCGCTGRSLWSDSVSPKYGRFGLFPVVDRPFVLCNLQTVPQCYYYYTLEADVHKGAG